MKSSSQVFNRFALSTVPSGTLLRVASYLVLNKEETGKVWKVAQEGYVKRLSEGGAYTGQPRPRQRSSIRSSTSKGDKENLPSP